MTGLDDDHRSPDQQAADFFGRPGDYHQVKIEVPEATNAECVIKVTAEQLPLAVEILRQIRGALYARITLTPLQHIAPDTTAEPEPLQPAEPVVTFWDENFNAVEPPNNNKYNVVDTQFARERLREVPDGPAHVIGEPCQPTPIPMTNGQTAWAVTPPTKPATTSGRHRAPEQDFSQLHIDPKQAAKQFQRHFNDKPTPLWNAPDTTTGDDE